MDNGNFNELLSSNARKVLEKAKSLSTRYRCSFIGSEHIVYAILATGNCVASSILNELGVNLSRYVLLFEQELVTETNIVGFTPRTKAMLMRAMEFSMSSRNSFVGTEHILLAVQSTNAVTNATQLA